MSTLKSSAPNSEQYHVAAVDRALDVLRTFTHQRPELSLTEISTQTRLHKATAFRLLATLCHAGMTTKNPATGLYRLGFAVIAMSEVAKTSTGFVSQARPVMRHIRDELNETVYIAVRTGDERISLDQLESLRDIRRVVAIGKPTPLYQGSTSHVLLAAMSDDAITAYFNRTTLVPPFPGATVDPPSLWRAIAEIRQAGYAETYNKLIGEGASISAAVHGPANEVLGALTVSVPISRYKSELRARIIDIVTRSARALSRQLGAP
jgi:DNA-binding IclR family transcriptional regulator